MRSIPYSTMGQKIVLTAFNPPSGGGGGSGHVFVVMREATCARTLPVVLLKSSEALEIPDLSFV
jgi:hypothetical protein